MNFEVIHPETAKFFQNTETPLEVVALAVSGRHPERKQCFAYIDCVLNYKQVMAGPILLALLEEFGFTWEYGIGVTMEYPLWSMKETYDLHSRPHSGFLARYPYRNDPATRSRRRNEVLPYWVEEHGTGEDSELNKMIPYFCPPRIGRRASESEILVYLEKVLVPSEKVSNFLLNIDSRIEIHKKITHKHNERMQTLWLKKGKL